MPRFYEGDEGYIDRALRDAGLGPVIDAQIRTTFKTLGLPAALGQMNGVKAAQRFKASMPADVVDQALERGRMTATEAAKNGPDAQIAAEIDQFFRALAQKYGVPGASGGGAKLTDSGDGSKPAATKAYDAKTDAFAQALGADQVQR